MKGREPRHVRVDVGMEWLDNSSVLEFRNLFETEASEANLSESDRKLYSENFLHSRDVAEDYYVSKNIDKTVWFLY